MLFINIKDHAVQMAVEGDSKTLAIEMLEAIRGSYIALKNVDEEAAAAFLRILRNDLDDVINSLIHEVEIHKMNKDQ